MSRLYVDRISPYQSASVTVDGLDTSTLTTKTTFNSYTASNDSKVTSLINATSSYASTTTNTFNGNQTITGSVFQSGSDVQFTVGAAQNDFLINNSTSKFYTFGDTWGNLKGDNSQGMIMSNQYGFNVFNSSYTKDFGFALDVNTAVGTGDSQIGFYGAGGGGYNTFITFQDGTNWTDGRVEFHTPISASAGVTGSFAVNGGETTLSGNTTVNAEKLIIDNPNANHLLEVNANAVAQFKGNTNQYNESTSYSVTRQQGKTTELYLNAYSSSYDNGFRVIGDDSFNGFKLQDWNGSYTWSSWMEVAKDDKVSIKRVLNLAAQDPLPAGALGDLSVSGSSLYFHNGTSWGVIS